MTEACHTFLVRDAAAVQEVVMRPMQPQSVSIACERKWHGIDRKTLFQEGYTPVEYGTRLKLFLHSASLGS